ncbi:MAG: hypothetical protein KC492_44505 [Myxococcales bacterium]|nr:hypothetical protein [Myxococcales bacterium]
MLISNDADTFRRAKAAPALYEALQAAEETLGVYERFFAGSDNPFVRAAQTIREKAAFALAAAKPSEVQP